MDGVDSEEGAELRAATKRIKAWEKELELVTDASELVDAQAVVPPKDDIRHLWVTEILQFRCGGVDVSR